MGLGSGPIVTAIHHYVKTWRNIRIRQIRFGTAPFWLQYLLLVSHIERKVRWEGTLLRLVPGRRTLMRLAVKLTHQHESAIILGALCPDTTALQQSQSKCPRIKMRAPADLNHARLTPWLHRSCKRIGDVS